ncbi:hypothetical protein JR316_0006881 [Psilocybe cubensis]|uniref:Uncharacterized protein n=2 Tax=Psilocybe cubensis TaxID=181762 RepID=A0A8H7XPL2_PSICU|nr:hypothetical protein JR316_0006881 [Psilocybe cubensis]KAH9480283.1 hypothetical protein JR316_0006881 [Psilocybe cubensis]
MFSKIFKIAVVASALVASAAALPTSVNTLTARGDISFDNWGGISSFSGFDNFYGSDNFIGAISSQTVVEQSSELVCHSESIEIIQQRLLVLQEMAKRIITEQVCEVETQTVVFEQFHASLGLFSHDLRRTSGHHVGFDESITSHFSDIVAEDDSLTTDDFGFTGHDLGAHTVVVGGSNWVDATSPASVGAAYSAARGAFYSSF